MPSNYYNNPFLDDNVNYDEKVPGYTIVAIAQTICILFAVLMIFYLFIVIPNEVNGPSMRETLQNKDQLFTNKFIQIFGGEGSTLYAIFGDYKRGDIITFKKKEEGSYESELVKRVIAIGGDKVRISGGKVYVNGVELNEPYLADGTYYNPNPTYPGDEANHNILNKGATHLKFSPWFTEDTEIYIPEGKYFVMGDNRNNSVDSRASNVKFVDRNEIIGKVFWRWWPLGKFGSVDSHNYEELNGK